MTALVASSPRAAGAANSCDLLLQHGAGAEPFNVQPLAGVTQPIGVVGNVAACSLTVEGYYGMVRMDVVQWDPLTLAPDPTSIALRTRSFNLTAYEPNRGRGDFYPPLVTRVAANVADPPRSTIAIDWRSTYASHLLRFDPNGPPEVPTALQFAAPGAPRTPLPGAHPVLSHAVCGGDEGLQRLQVIQSVMTTNGVSDTASFDLIQRFRVPVRSRLNFVEVAFGVPPRPLYYDPKIAILDAEGQSQPRVNLPPSLVEAPYQFWVGSPFWGTHYDFDRIITLEPDHDYWLLVRVEHQYVLYSRTLTGTESPDFTAAIGPYFQRTTLGGNWQPVDGRALSFRMIGEPVTSPRNRPRGRLERPGETAPGREPDPGRSKSTDDARASASGAELAAGPLRLKTTPNPSQGAVLVSWSGARGPLRIDVLDTQGRRVAGDADLVSAQGQWTWRASHEDGRPLPAGMYFVRASEPTGRFAAQRVVLIR